MESVFSGNNASDTEKGTEIPVEDANCNEFSQMEPRLNEKSKKIDIRKVKEPGIIYLGYIPRLMNVRKVKEIFSQYGELGRVFLQPEKQGKKGKPSKFFKEGWIEFKSKKVAKKVTQFLNGKQIGGKRRCLWYDSLWSLKYLHGFKWTHLSEKLSFEKAVHEQKLRNEISQAKREANFYAHTVEKTNREKRKRPKEETEVIDIPQYVAPVYQQPTDSEMRQKSKKTKTVDRTFLKSVFGGGIEEED